MAIACFAQHTHQDSLRGSLNAERTWWDVTLYKITVDADIDGRQIKGSNSIGFNVTEAGTDKVMQIDLQEPMMIDRITDRSSKRVVPFTREGNVYHVAFGSKNFTAGKSETIDISFHGVPRKAVNPPWDGGWIWTKDNLKRPWVTVACQGLGASVWYPCKDYQGDEPDQGASISVIIPDTLVAVANGRPVGKPAIKAGRATYTWQVKSPINNYDIVPYIGKYVYFGETFKGGKGDLACDYWVIDYNLDKAKQQFGRDVKRMLSCFEEWFGPYPFYEDHYKLVEAPHLGMEHQSAVAYGNKYKNGYMGMDYSGSGWGKDWDYIIVHESGHEWFGNSVTTKDIADMWVHEGFTTYSEVLFTECQHGKQAGNEYLAGLRRTIDNKTPVIGPYGINEEGSGDMYSKGASMIHIIRQLINDDVKFKGMLRGIQKDFYHQLVTSAQIEAYMTKASGIDLSKIFDQYLRNTEIPVLEYKVDAGNASFRWTKCVPGFDLPVRIVSGDASVLIRPGTEWKTETLPAAFNIDHLEVDKNFYVFLKKP